MTEARSRAKSKRSARKDVASSPDDRRSQTAERGTSDAPATTTDGAVAVAGRGNEAQVATAKGPPPKKKGKAAARSAPKAKTKGQGSETSGATPAAEAADAAAKADKPDKAARSDKQQDDKPQEKSERAESVDKPDKPDEAAAPSPAKPAAKAARSTPPVVREIEALRKALAPWRKSEELIALVPTMGALHDGHMRLVAEARKRASRVVVSIFVNPAQFAPHEDLDRYPRTEKADLARLADAGIDLVWSPPVAEMYPEGFSTRIRPGSAAEGLETDFRPHFFGGVTTVVAKLFNQVQPNFALFGEKDYQQLIVIRQMVRDLDMPLEIVSVPTVRESDGLAMSSRNAYLNTLQRDAAPTMNRVLRDVADHARTAANLSMLRAEASMKLITLGFSKVDYVEVRDAATLGSFDPAAGRPGRVLAAAWMGSTRLIDNVEIPV